MQLPLRVLVLGPSSVVWTSPMGGPRTDMAFPRVMEQQLLSGGLAADVRCSAVLGMPASDLFKTWDEDIVAWSPDIVVLMVGHYEALHLLLPRWLERGANTVNRRPGFFRTFYYRKLMRATARGVIHLQKRVDGPNRTLNRRMRRTVADTAAYIKMIRQVGSPLVLLTELHPPGQDKPALYPGWAPRLHRLNNEWRALVATIDQPDVRFVEIMDLVETFDPAERDHLWTDGIHYVPKFHRAVGERLAGIAEEWARDQPHLAHP